MLNEIKNERPQPGSFIVFDLETVVTDTRGHQAYLPMERYKPCAGSRSRRGYAPQDDPLITPRWVFQSIVAASAMLLTQHPEGNLQIESFETWTAETHNEPAIVTALLNLMADVPQGTRLASWGGAWHDIPMLLRAAQTCGATLPAGWDWLSFGGDGRVAHVDLQRIVTGGSKMKLIHMAEYAAAVGVPAKITERPFAPARLYQEKAWEKLEEVVEGDVITTACLLARWKRLQDGRADIDTVTDRLLRQVAELKPGRGYLRVLAAYRTRHFQARVAQCTRDAAVLAPWLDEAA